MSIKIKKGFDKNSVLYVDVRGCSIEECKKVQEVFFALGYCWETGGNSWRDINPETGYYTNALGDELNDFLLYGCNVDIHLKSGVQYLSPKEFFDLVLDESEEDEDSMIPFDLEKYSSGCYDVYNTYSGNIIHSDELEIVTVNGNGGAVLFNEEFQELYVLPLKYLHLKPKNKHHTVNGVKIPDLRIKEMMSSRNGYMVSVGSPDFYGTCEIIPNYLVNRGLVYERTEEGKQAAILHAKALLGMVE